MKKQSSSTTVTVLIYDDKTPGFLKKVTFKESYVTNVLGFDSSILTEDKVDMVLHAQIYDEHVMLEGFLDFVRGQVDKLKQFGGNAIQLFETLKTIIDEGVEIDVIKDRAITYAKKNIKRILEQGDVNVSYTETLQSLISNASSSAGWWGMLSSIAVFLLTETFVQNVEWFKTSTTNEKVQELIEIIQDDLMSKGGTDTLVSWIRYAIIVLGKFINVVSSTNKLFSSSLKLSKMKMPIQ